MKKEKVLLLIIFIIGLAFIIKDKGSFIKKDNNVNSKQFSFYLNGDKYDNAPIKDSGYKFEKAICKNEDGTDSDIVISWNNDTWNVNVSNIKMKGTKCDLYFVKEYVPEPLNSYFKNLPTSDTVYLGLITIIAIIITNIDIIATAGFKKVSILIVLKALTNNDSPVYALK